MPSKNLSDLDARAAAQRLRTACTSGVLADAYRIVNGLSRDDLPRVMLYAGFVVSGNCKAERADLRDYQQQIAEACGRN